MPRPKGSGSLEILIEKAIKKELEDTSGLDRKDRLAVIKEAREWWTVRQENQSNQWGTGFRDKKEKGRKEEDDE